MNCFKFTLRRTVFVYCSTCAPSLIGCNAVSAAYSWVGHRLVIRSKTCWPDPMKDAIHALQDGIADSIGKVGDLAGEPLLLCPTDTRLVMILQSQIDACWTCDSRMLM